MASMSSTPAWRRTPEVGTAWGLRFIAFLCRVFGRSVTSGFLWLVCVYYALTHGRARRASRAFLERLGQPTTLRTVIAHFWYFARTSTDRYFFLTGKTSEFEVQQHGHDRVMKALGGARGRGALLLGSHVGSFEAMRAVARRSDVPLTVVVDWRTAQKMNGVLAEVSPNLNVRLIGLDPARAATSMLEVKACIDRGELVAMLGDRLTERDDRAVEVDFFGGRARFPSGPFLLAHMLGCPVYLVFALFSAPNRYDVHCELFADAVELPRASRNEGVRKYAQAYAARIESYVSKAPLNWFNFYDFWLESKSPPLDAPAAADATVTPDGR